jgi:hypothetical protein
LPVRSIGGLHVDEPETSTAGSRCFGLPDPPFGALRNEVYWRRQATIIAASRRVLPVANRRACGKPNGNYKALRATPMNMTVAPAIEMAAQV